MSGMGILSVDDENDCADFDLMTSIQLIHDNQRLMQRYIEKILYRLEKLDKENV